jgi:hypothetical protein
MGGINIILVLGHKYFIEFSYDECLVGSTLLILLPKLIQEDAFLLQFISRKLDVELNFFGLVVKGELLLCLLCVVLGNDW